MKRFICFAITVLCLFSLSAKAQLVGTERLLDNQWLLDDKGIWFGNLPDVKCEYDSHQDVDALVCGLSAESNLFVIAQLADKDKDFNLTKPAYPAIRLMAPGGDPSKYIQIGHDGTNAIVDAGSGSVSFPHGLSATVTPNGMMTFPAGAAVTAASYQAGRDADGTNQYHINVPTGAAIELSVNDVPKVTVDAYGADLKDGDISNVGNISLDSIEADATAGTITMKGATAGTNKENLVWDFETLSNVVGISSTTGVMGIDFGTIGLMTPMIASNSLGKLTLGEQMTGTNNEQLTFDFETTANKVLVTSTTGVTEVDFGTVDLNADLTGNADTATALASNPSDCSANTFANAIDASSNLSCVALSDADIPNNITIDVATLTQEDVGATCDVGQVRLDTGGATKELCYCESANSWVCTAMTAGPTD